MMINIIMYLYILCILYKYITFENKILKNYLQKYFSRIAISLKIIFTFHIISTDKI